MCASPRRCFSTSGVAADTVLLFTATDALPAHLAREIDRPPTLGQSFAKAADFAALTIIMDDAVADVNAWLDLEHA
jgi:hypothetical protein